MSVRLWEKLSPGTALDTIREKLNEWMKTNGAVFTGGDRASGALDATGTLTTGVAGDATIAGKPAGGVAANYSVEFQETFETAPADWPVLSGVRAQSVVSTGQTGGKAVRQTGPVAQAFPWPLPYDATKLHRLRASVKRVSGSGTFSYGVRALDANGTVLGTYALAALAVAPSSGYTEYTGWLQGYGATSTPAPDPKLPAAMPAGTTALQPYFALNTGDPTGVMELDSISYDRQEETVVAAAVNALILPTTTNPTDLARYAAGARTVANAVDSPAIQQDVAIVGLLKNLGGTAFLDLRTTPPAGSIIVSLPGLVADNLGNAVFSGVVAAASFTAPVATFVGTVHLGGSITVGGNTAITGHTTINDYLTVFGNLDVGAITHLGDGDISGTWTFSSGSTVLFLSGFVSSSAVITTLAHVGSTAGFFGTAPHSQPSLTYSRAIENAAQTQLRLALAALGLVADATIP